MPRPACQAQIRSESLCPETFRVFCAN